MKCPICLQTMKIKKRVLMGETFREWYCSSCEGTWLLTEKSYLEKIKANAKRLKDLREWLRIKAKEASQKPTFSVIDWIEELLALLEEEKEGKQ